MVWSAGFSPSCAADHVGTHLHPASSMGTWKGRASDAVHAYFPPGAILLDVKSVRNKKTLISLIEGEL